MKKNTPTIAQSIVKQVKSKTTEISNITYLENHNISQTLLKNSIENGTEKLVAQFQNGRSEKLEIDISIFLKFTNLCKPFSVGFLAWGGNKRDRTRVEQFSLLRRYFFNFLIERGQENIELDDFNSELFSSFKKWLDKHNTDGKQLATETRRVAIAAVKHIFTSLMEEKEWTIIARNINSIIPKAPYPLSYKSNRATQRLSRENLKKIITAAQLDLERIRRGLENSKELILQGRKNIDSEDFSYRDFSTCLAQLDIQYSGIVPVIPDIKKQDAQLAKWVSKHGTLKLTAGLYPTARDLVPFIILMCIDTVFNTDQVLNLSWSDINYIEDRLGFPAIKIESNKYRSSEKQIKILDAGSNDERTSLKSTLDLLKEITNRLRISIKNKEHIGKLYIFIQKNNEKNPKPFGSKIAAPSTDGPLKDAIANFIKDYNLEYFTIGQIRPTILDEVQYNNGNITDAQAVGGHKNLHTTWNHYTSDGTKMRYQERIGEILMLRDRWLETEGVIDPRTRLLLQDKGAATPGFICLDPFKSPRNNQQEGKLCSAYGECPSCPLAAADVGNITSIAMYKSLQNAIYSAQTRISPVVWLKRWSPVASDLEALLSLAPKNLLIQADFFTIELPSVG